MNERTYKLLLNDFDTIHCAYYLEPFRHNGLNFESLFQKQEEINLSKKKYAEPIILGNAEFLLEPHGTKSGYSFLISNKNFKISFGEFNNPNFHVIFSSESLWKNTAFTLHEKFLEWALSIGYQPYIKESLSRVDYCFDFNLPEIDFNEDSFKSRSTKNSIYRENKTVQTFTLGRGGDIVLRVYDKIAEIDQNSPHKAWFFKLWGQKTNVWRIEWQVKKKTLKRFDILTFDGLKTSLGDLLQYLATEHDTLRIPCKDSNKSRWPLHPLWESLINKISKLDCTGIYKTYDLQPAFDLQLHRVAVAILGYSKRAAAIQSVQNNLECIDYKNALKNIQPYINKIYDPLTWQNDVKRRKKEIELGKWSTKIK